MPGRGITIAPVGTCAAVFFELQASDMRIPIATMCTIKPKNSYPLGTGDSPMVLSLSASIPRLLRRPAAAADSLILRMSGLLGASAVTALGYHGIALAGTGQLWLQLGCLLRSWRSPLHHHTTSHSGVLLKSHSRRRSIARRSLICLRLSMFFRPLPTLNPGTSQQGGGSTVEATSFVALLGQAVA